MKSKIVILSIAACISIIMLGSVLVPVINDTSEKEATLTNEGYYFMDSVDPATDTILLEWDHTNPSIVTVNSIDYDMQDIPKGQAVTVLGGDNFIVRYYVTTSGVTYIQSYGTTYVGVNDGETDDITVTLSSGNLKITTTSNPTGVTYQPSTIYSITQSGQYVLKKATSTAFVKSDSDLIALGRSQSGSVGTCVYMTGNIDDGMTISYYYDGSNTPTNDDIVINANGDGRYVDVYVFKDITFDITQSTTTYPVTYSYLLVPAEITAEKSAHLDDGQINILSTIPVIIIIAIILMVASLFIKNRE